MMYNIILIMILFSMQFETMRFFAYRKFSYWNVGAIYILLCMNFVIYYIGNIYIQEHL
jgi:uncharacterized membrane protein